MDNSTEKNLDLRIPPAMVAEHQELHEELYAATLLPGEVGEAARRVADALHQHFEKEEEFALPPLGLLPVLARGELTSAMAGVLPYTDRLRAELPEMLLEHQGVVAALEALSAAAVKAQQPRFVKFAEKLKLHAQTEEEVSYPAAILIGEYIKLKLGK